MYIDASRGSPNVKPPMWAIDPGIVAYNCLRHGMPLPVLAMPLWEGAGNRAVDLSGWMNHGTINGSDWVAGSFGLALDFVSVNNDYIDCGNGASLNINNDFTILVWMKASPNTDGQIVMWGEDATAKRRSLMCYGHPGDSNLLFSGYGATSNLDSGIIVADDDWHHCVVTVNSSDYVRTYVDGIAGNHGSVTLAAYNYTGLDVGRSIGGSEYFNGLIDDIFIFNRVLSAVQIKFLYNNPYFMYQIPEEFYGYSINNPIWYYEMLKRRN